MRNNHKTSQIINKNTSIHKISEHLFKKEKVVFNVYFLFIQNFFF